MPSLCSEQPANGATSRQLDKAAVQSTACVTSCEGQHWITSVILTTEHGCPTDNGEAVPRAPHQAAIRSANGNPGSNPDVLPRLWNRAHNAILSQRLPPASSEVLSSLCWVKLQSGPLVRDMSVETKGGDSICGVRARPATVKPFNTGNPSLQC